MNIICCYEYTTISSLKISYVQQKIAGNYIYKHSFKYYYMVYVFHRKKDNRTNAKQSHSIYPVCQSQKVIAK